MDTRITTHKHNENSSANGVLSRRLVLTLGLTCLVAPSVLAGVQQILAPEPLHRFNGETWSGIVLGRTTRDELKRRYRTQGGQFIRAAA
jgi:hypothetical protein